MNKEKLIDWFLWTILILAVFMFMYAILANKKAKETTENKFGGGGHGGGGGGHHGGGGGGHWHGGGGRGWGGGYGWGGYGWPYYLGDLPNCPYGFIWRAETMRCEPI